jgi:hypothetical protein
VRGKIAVFGRVAGTKGNDPSSAMLGG